MTAPSVLYPPPPAEGLPAGRLLLGAYLRRLREGRGIPQARAARLIRKSISTLSRYESGRVPIEERDLRALLLLYGQDTPRGLADAVQLLHHVDDHEYHDAGAWEQGRVEAIESLAKEITVLTCWAIPPILYSESAAQRAVEDGGTLGPFARPRPACPITLLVEEPVLRRPHGGAAAMADQLQHVADLARRGALTIRVFPILDALPEGVGVLSEITLAGASGTIWVEDRVPTFFTGPAATWQRALIYRVRESAHSPGESLGLVVAAAHYWTAKAAGDPGKGTAAPGLGRAGQPQTRPSGDSPHQPQGRQS